MLETIGLTKTYRPKRGVPVKALDNVTIRFPETGMVFLLGKSGSGKSTLLNLLGGLDRYDGGEIVIKGVSSRSFSQQRFDSYRNTYVGFIFQEYNVLEEFSVGANIALAIELQGRKAENEEVDRILKAVDLDGYGARRPNELSGGQLQRVAIARALVKNPQIIMADEPTGALDSVTGRQVLDTLKRLSAEKLVIVVSHDREFAERYADRIVELSDGRVIRDVECDPAAPEEDGAEGLSFSGDAVEVAAGYQLTEQDRLAINEYLAARDKGIALRVRAFGRRFRPTDPDSIPRQDGRDFRLIKSKLPLKAAFRIGASGLRFKKFRLVMTILLSTWAFTMFALADTFGAYNHVRTCVDSILDSNVTYAAVKKAVHRGEGLGAWWDESTYRLTDEELASFAERTGTALKGVYIPETLSLNASASVGRPENEDEIRRSRPLLGGIFSGLTEVSDGDLEKLGYELVAGRLPAPGADDEVAVSRLFCETFEALGYVAPGGDPTAPEAISDPGALVGRRLDMGDRQLTICGVVDTGFDLSRYADLADEEENLSTGEILVRFVLAQEYEYAVRYSFCSLAFAGEGTVSELARQEARFGRMTDGEIYFRLGGILPGDQEENGLYISAWPEKTGRLTDVDPAAVIWTGRPETALGEKEVLIAASSVNLYDENDPSSFASRLTEGRLDGVLGGVKVLETGLFFQNEDEPADTEGWRVAGFLDTEKYPEYAGVVVASDAFVGRLTKDRGSYAFAVGAMPSARTDLTRLVKACYDDSDSVRFPLQNAVTYELDIVRDVLRVTSRGFLYGGLFYAVFAALLLANFIAVSISYKKQEIGILRAIGSRSADVFRIFFAESFLIAMINFIQAAVLAGVATAIVNVVIRSRLGVLITVLHYGVRQIALLLVISLAVAAAASFLPVRRIASKRPIDAIRNR
ncbi:MAG: ATP-binding cassette domain-containing protein [Oscillospiraceae bacterium]|nr:ATP-binding cassette domain-containing protein [Oscillospiraceae bacterium]